MKTDSQLQQDVIAELKWEPAVNGAGNGVEVKDGIVTLAGHVASLIEVWIDETERRTWFLFEASRPADASGH